MAALFDIQRIVAYVTVTYTKHKGLVIRNFVCLLTNLPDQETSFLQEAENFFCTTEEYFYVLFIDVKVQQIY